MLARTRIALTGSVCLLGLGSMAVSAQQASDQPILLETVILTANKRAQALEDIDASVSVVSGEDIDARGIRSVDDLQKVFPGLSIGNRGSRIYSNMTVRGISSPDYFNPTVQVYVDGVPQLPSTFSQPIGNVERVELLRGPQGTLYGANAFGGVVNIITRTPDHDSFHVETTISAQEPGLGFGGTKVLVPDQLFLDFAGRFERFSGDIDDSGTGNTDINSGDDGFARLSLRYAPVDGDFDAALTFSKERLHTHEELYVLQSDVEGRIYDSTIMGDLPELDRDVATLSGTWNYRFGDFTLSGTTAWQESDVGRDFSSGAGSRYIWPQNDESISQELRLAYETGRFSGVAGLWYKHGDFFGSKNGYPGYYGDSTNKVATESLAVFGEGTWNLTDRLDLTAGLRVSHERAEIDGFRDDAYSNGYGFDFANKADFTGVQPKLAIGYELAPETRVFGLVSRGYKAGGFNHSISSIIDATPYDPETAWNFETGIRSALLDGTLDVAASLYHIRSFDKQIYVGQLGQQFIRNVGEATSSGIELEAAWRASARLTLTGNAAYGRSKFTDFTDPYTGVSYDGNRVPYAPDLTARVLVSYIVSDDMFGGTLTANGGANFTSKTWFDEANTSGQGSYATFDASLDLALASGLNARLYAQNIADESYKTSGYINGPYEFGNLGKGRTIGLTLRKEF